MAAWGALSSGRGLGCARCCRALGLAPRCARCSRWVGGRKGRQHENCAWRQVGVAAGMRCRKARECSNRERTESTRRLLRACAAPSPPLAAGQARSVPVGCGSILMIWKSSAVTSSATKGGRPRSISTRCRASDTGQRGDRLRRPCRCCSGRHVEPASRVSAHWSGAVRDAIIFEMPKSSTLTNRARPGSPLGRCSRFEIAVDDALLVGGIQRRGDLP